MSETKQQRGAFICIEGIDHAGKTTQAKMLVDTLCDCNCRTQMMQFPDRTTEIGKILDAYLRANKELSASVVHMLFCCNRWEKTKEIYQQLKTNQTTLVVDRYSYSGAAYTCAKQIDGIDIRWCMNTEHRLPQPDVVIYLDITPEMALSRHDTNVLKERYEENTFLTQVQESYSRVKYFATTNGVNWMHVDGNGTPEEVHQRVMAAVTHALKTVDLTTPIKTI